VSITENVQLILEKYPKHFRQLIILLGVKELCKIDKKDDLEQIVSFYGIDSGYFKMMITEVIQDSTFDQVIEGELYNDLIKLQLWLNDYDKNDDVIFSFDDL